MDVVDPPTGGTSPASSDPEQQLIIIHLDTDDNRQPRRPYSIVKELELQKRIQPDGLGLSSRKTVQNKAALRIRLTQTPGHNVTNHVIGNQLASGDDLAHLKAKGRTLLHMLPEEIPGRNLRDTVMLGDPLRLSSLTCSRWSKQHDRSDVSQHLLCHRTGPNPLLTRNYGHIKFQSLYCATLLLRGHAQDCSPLLPAAPPADSSAAWRKSVVVTHDQLRLDLINCVHRDAHHDQERRSAKIEIYA